MQLYICAYANVLCIYLYMYGLSLIAAVSSIVVGAIATVVVVAFLLSSAALLCWLKVQQSLDAFGLLKQTQLYKRLKSNEQPLTSPPQYRWSVSYLNCIHVYYCNSHAIYLYNTFRQFIVHYYSYRNTFFNKRENLNSSKKK